MSSYYGTIDVVSGELNYKYSQILFTNFFLVIPAGKATLFFIRLKYYYFINVFLHILFSFHSLSVINIVRAIRIREQSKMMLSSGLSMNRSQGGVILVVI